MTGVQLAEIALYDEAGAVLAVASTGNAGGTNLPSASQGSDSLVDGDIFHQVV